MNIFKQTLRSRIFLSMILLVVVASILIALVTVYQYRQEAQDYHRDRLQRKEAAIRGSINHVLKETTYPVETEKIPLIFKDEIYEIKDIHGLELYLYDLKGNLLKSSKASFFKDTINDEMPRYALHNIENSPTKNFIEDLEADGTKYQSSYTYITDQYFKPIGILNLPYIEDDGFIQKELQENLSRLAIAYFFMLLFAFVLAYFLSKYITKSLKKVSEKITETRLDKRNKKIVVEDTTMEIAVLVNAYNGMIDELQISAAQLAASEREAAWREMAKQVAHEIKNPLTPMRLTVQSFQRKFNPLNPDIEVQMKEYSDTLIQQIDTMSSIASAFSTYAKMPIQQDEMLNVVKITKLALDIFHEDYITFISEEENIQANLDRTQLIRVVTNLIKNSVQAVEHKNPINPKVEVTVFTDNNTICITVEDNGIGIPEENKQLIFEPKFTTKNSGMGLGLAMVKRIVENYQGTITLAETLENNTLFKVCFPKI